MTKTTPLSEGEKQWQQHFMRKLADLHKDKKIYTSFLDPRQLELAEAVLKKETGLSYIIYGGYPEAERNILYIFPAEHQPALPALKAVQVNWSGDKSDLGHRDLLGAVLALGLQRDQVGDIVFTEENAAVIIVADDKAEYISSNLDQVGRLPVHCMVIDPGQLAPAKDDGKDVKGTVASLRVDAVLSLGFGISRARVVRLVKGGVVRVNWRPINSPSIQLTEGDQVSLKGRGRLIITSVGDETRKGRIHLKLKKYS